VRSRAAEVQRHPPGRRPGTRWGGALIPASSLRGVRAHHPRAAWSARTLGFAGWRHHRWSMRPLRTALVLGGGGARGAYEAGVIAYLREELEPALGHPIPLQILSGTSVGAMNACHLAA